MADDAHQLVKVTGEELELVVLPNLGARLHSLSVRGRNVLRTPAHPSEHEQQPFFWGGFVMAPWCNRLASGPLFVGHERVELAANFSDGTAIHGQVYLARWQQTGPGSFALESGGHGWPWRYRVEIDYRILGSQLVIRERITNLSDTSMPAGIGLHPWFNLPIEVAVHGDRVFATNVNSAAEPEPVSGELDLRQPGAIAAGVDATWPVSSDPAVDLAWPDALTMAMHATHPALHITAARAAEFDAVAVEPQTHAPQGLRRLINGEPGALAVLKPGATLELPITLDFGAVGAEASIVPDPFDVVIAHALDNLPAEFRAQLESVAIVVDDNPTAHQLASTHSHGLFGIYEGIPRTALGAGYAPYPSKITLFRGTLEAHSASADDLQRLIEETLLHELGHHLGISDARLSELALERRRNPQRRATDAR